MEFVTKEDIRMANMKAKALKHLTMVVNTRANGKVVKRTDTEFTHFLMAGAMKEII